MKQAGRNTYLLLAGTSTNQGHGTLTEMLPPCSQTQAYDQRPEPTAGKGPLSAVPTGSEERILKASSFSLLVPQEATVWPQTGATALPHSTQVVSPPRPGRPEATDTNLPPETRRGYVTLRVTADSWLSPGV